MARVLNMSPRIGVWSVPARQDPPCPLTMLADLLDRFVADNVECLSRLLASGPQIDLSAAQRQQVAQIRNLLENLDESIIKLRKRALFEYDKGVYAVLDEALGCA